MRAATGPGGPSPRLTRARAHDYGFVLDDGDGRTAGVFSIAPEASAAAGTEIAAVLGGPPGGSGNVAALRFDVPARRQVSYLLAVAFWHGGTVTQGDDRDCTYWYARLFDDIEDAAAYALEHFERLTDAHLAAAAELDAAALSEPQRFQLAQAVRSYYGNTALLATPRDRPLWAVIEGEPTFVNTLDLAVDQLFLELRQNPWTVRNELDGYLERHSRRDEAGLAFTHDMGAFPRFSPPGTSAYEGDVWTTGEELTDWTLAALAYVAQTGDEAWARARLGALEQCLESLLARSPDGLPGGLRHHHLRLARPVVATGAAFELPRGQAVGRLRLPGRVPRRPRPRGAGPPRGRAGAARGRPARRRGRGDRLPAGPRHRQRPHRRSRARDPGRRGPRLPAVRRRRGRARPRRPLRRLRAHAARASARRAGLRRVPVPRPRLEAQLRARRHVAGQGVPLPVRRAADPRAAAQTPPRTRPTRPGCATTAAGSAGGERSRSYARGVTAALWLEEHPATARLTTAPADTLPAPYGPLLEAATREPARLRRP